LHWLSWTLVSLAALGASVMLRRPPRTATTSDGPLPWAVLKEHRCKGYVLCLCGAGRRYGTHHIRHQIIHARRTTRYELTVACFRCCNRNPIAGLDNVIQHDDGTVYYDHKWYLDEAGVYHQEKGPGSPLYISGYFDPDV